MAFHSCYIIHDEFFSFSAFYKGLNFWRRFPYLNSTGLRCVHPRGSHQQNIENRSAPPVCSHSLPHTPSRETNAVSPVVVVRCCGGLLARCEDQPKIEEVFPIRIRKSKPNAFPTRFALFPISSYSTSKWGRTLARFHENILDGRSVFLLLRSAEARFPRRFAIGSSTTLDGSPSAGDARVEGGAASK